MRPLQAGILAGRPVRSGHGQAVRPPEPAAAARHANTEQQAVRKAPVMFAYIVGHTNDQAEINASSAGALHIRMTSLVT